MTEQRAEIVVTYGDATPCDARSHDAVSRRNIARRLAATLGCEFGGEYEPGRARGGAHYFVPKDTLDAGAATTLGIATEGDLFGGVVPHPFVATKAITHPLVDPAADAPPGWAHEFAEWVGDAVLPGYTVFNASDARRAARTLLDLGPVRVKRSTGIGGAGQYVLRRARDLDNVLAKTDTTELARSGVVMEQDLADVTTFSVGQVRIHGAVISYWGTQRSTRNHRGRDVYGGSVLDIVRGNFAALLAMELPVAARHAVELARRYDEAAMASFPGILASRRNYDVAQGRDAAGFPRAGVLEQSWRIGGASGAEVVALEALLCDPACGRVRASTAEIYAAEAEVPPSAFVYFRGTDANAGPLVKFATLSTDGDK